MGNQGQGVGQENQSLSNAAAVVSGIDATALGSTDTSIIRYTAANVTDASGAFTLTEDATLGSDFECVRPGLWCIELFGAIAGAALLNLGISLNAAAGVRSGAPSDFVTTGGGGIDMGWVGIAGNLLATSIMDIYLCRHSWLVPGDVIRFAATVGVTLDADNSRFFMTPIILN